MTSILTLETLTSTEAVKTAMTRTGSHRIKTPTLPTTVIPTGDSTEGHNVCQNSPTPDPLYMLSSDSSHPRRTFVTQSFVFRDLPLDDHRLFFLRKDYCLPSGEKSTMRQPSLLTALSPRSKRPSSPPSPPFMAWGGCGESVPLTRKLCRLLA